MRSVPSDEKRSSKWFVYLIRTPSNALYCGITTDVERRFQEHSKGKGAKALKGKSPLILAWHDVAGDNRSEASQIEYHLKRLTKPKKEALASGSITLEQALKPFICKNSV
ncbi:GIY-YIG nuclease family protein [uncultured Vibrio sp.]|uniref:GIY-YIG nuclease family protein n=1 Tax=uncultured Vibrio sp. TaxID=114054 RepID=UPI0025E56CB0|nr:GIY-YIG nuclease family protein [uncultured Vibrio sp.]